jgi:hypothetical protein
MNDADSQPSQGKATPSTSRPDHALRAIVAEPLECGAKIWNSVQALVQSTALPSEPLEPAQISRETGNFQRRGPEIQQVSHRDPQQSAPVRIDHDAEGRLIISSEDEAAVELVRKLIGDMAVTPADFKVFRMKHKQSSAFSIAENLKQLFEQKQKADRTSPRFFDPNTGKWITNSREGDAARKGQKPVPPRFIVDVNSNSILAVGADAGQLETIEQVIALYDTAESRDALPTRTTRLIKIKHAQVRQIAESIKDVYRDLLTVNEPVQRNDQRERPPEPRYTFVYSSLAGGDVAETQVRFKGQLSIGMDEPSNTVIVSAPTALLEDVARTIALLDEASLPLATQVRVVQVNRHLNAADFHKRLQRIATRPQTAQQQGGQSQSQRP